MEIRFFSREIARERDFDKSGQIVEDALDYYGARVISGIGPFPVSDALFVITALKKTLQVFSERYPDDAEQADILAQAFECKVSSVSVAGDITDALAGKILNILKEGTAHE